MSNIKEVWIEGTIPSDADGNDVILRFFGQCTLPTFGLNVQIEKHGTHVPNKHGGQTSMHKFRITGEEAIRFEFLDQLNAELAKVGTVDRYHTYDLEEGGR